MIDELEGIVDGEWLPLFFLKLRKIIQDSGIV